MLYDGQSLAIHRVINCLPMWALITTAVNMSRDHQSVYIDDCSSICPPKNSTHRKSSVLSYLTECSPNTQKMPIKQHFLHDNLRQHITVLTHCGYAPWVHAHVYAPRTIFRGHATLTSDKIHLSKLPCSTVLIPGNHQSHVL